MKVALVTGGARGIGRAIASDLARDTHVAVTWLTTDPGPLLTERPDVLAIRADLFDPATPARTIADVIARFGGLDLIVNNAGALAPDDSDDGRNHRVNVAAPMALLDAALPHLKPGACVINISSVNARLPAMGAAGYSASKAGLELWTRAMAKTHGPRGIRVNAVAPGAIERSEAPRPPDMVAAFVEMTALGRIGRPDDIANAVRFLASDAAAFITGETLTVSGGYRL